MSLTYDDARQKMQQLRSYYGKQKRDAVTIEEFCDYTGTKKNYVRMHVVSRKMEIEMIKTLKVSSLMELKPEHCELIEQHL